MKQVRVPEQFSMTLTLLKFKVMFPLIILIRILFVASMVFVIGYIFGNFSKTKTLATISKVAAILTIVTFIAANGVLMRFGGWHRGGYNQHNNCNSISKDSTVTR
jgi:hypothetical protein